MELLSPEPKSKIANLASDAAATEKQSPGFMEPGSKIKGKRGPKGPWKHKDEKEAGPQAAQGPAQKPPVDPVAELMPVTSQVTEFYSNFLIQFAEDDKAGLEPGIKQTMAHTGAVCLNQYFPNAMGVHAPLIVLLCIVGQTSFNAYMMRQMNLEKLKEQKRRQNAPAPVES